MLVGFVLLGSGGGGGCGRMRRSCTTSKLLSLPDPLHKQQTQDHPPHANGRTRSERGRGGMRFELKGEVWNGSGEV